MSASVRVHLTHRQPVEKCRPRIVKHLRQHALKLLGRRSAFAHVGLELRHTPQALETRPVEPPVDEQLGSRA